MTLRLSKIVLLAGVALFFTLVVFNNVTDYDSNYQFVHHVLAMDSTFPGNRAQWRHIDGAGAYRMFYLSIISIEALTAVLSWWGVVRLARRLRAAAAVFQQAKGVGIAALTLACLLWLVAFLSVGGEWFLMWQSHTWNGQEAAFRMFTVCALVLFYLSSAEPLPQTGSEA
jgi:predicted small integral membrane protein